VVFYDYDELEYLTDCRFRCFPEAPAPELEMSGEPWYPVGKSDIFPEEFATFLLCNPEIRGAFMKYHGDLLTPEFWQRTQREITDGHVQDFFPYSEAVRFCNVFRARDAEAVTEKTRGGAMVP